ncbi:MAG TPA: tripartite tricarboxylate transporter substrate binding protein [Burkholderiales bacterium]|nr:tripartite tricarboxylate transporter substrate binding protein [Burkholderiales bacterium]
MKLRMASLSLIGAVWIGWAHAQAYPVKPIRLIAPTTPGSPPDVRARWIAAALTPALGQAVVVENRAGAGGTIGTEAAAKSAPDGYTLVLAHQGTFAISPHVYARTGYDPIADFAPVTRLVVSPMVLAVHPDMPVKSVADLIHLAKEKPGQLTFGSAGNATPPHMAGELFRRAANIEVVHVPYKGASPALLDLIAGRLSYTIDGTPIQLPQVKAGKIRALAVTSVKRLDSLPDVPTVSESGLPGFEYWSWMGICAPAGTPKEIVSRLNQAIVGILRTPQAHEWLAAQGGEPAGEAPEEFAAFIKAEYVKWGDVVRASGITVD